MPTAHPALRRGLTPFPHERRSPTMRSTRPKALLIGLPMLLLGLVLAPSSAAAPERPAAPTDGGPVLVMGIDAEDGGVGGHGPVEVYAELVQRMFANVGNGASTILVLGGGKDPADDVTTFWNEIATITGRSVSFANGAADLATQPLTGFGLVVVSSSTDETSFGGLLDEESEALKARSLEVAGHVNGGGGLLSFSQTGQTTPYGFLGDLGSFARADIATGNDSDIDVTATGTAAGLTDDLDVCCWHDAYTEFPSFLVPLATFAGSTEVAAIGGASVVIPTGIELTTPSSLTVGGTCEIVATVVEDGQPQAGVDVAFVVIEGPHQGRGDTIATGADGTATFALLADAEGTDVVEASYLDSLDRVRTSTGRCTAVLAAAATPPAPVAPAAQPTQAAPAFTG